MNRRRAIRRIIAKASIFLLLGAIVNIAVAWACAAASPEQVWLQGRALRVTATVALRSAVSTGRPPIQPWTIEAWSRGIRQFGVPWRALQWEHAMTLPPARSSEIAQATTSPVSWRMGIDVSNLIGEERPGEMRRLPLTPIAKGVILNTLFYAAILWLLLATPSALRGWRHWRRIKRGLCPACAYPVGASDLCTECGKPVPDHSRLRV